MHLHSGMAIRKHLGPIGMLIFWLKGVLHIGYYLETVVNEENCL